MDRYIFSSSDNGNCNFPRVCGGREANHSAGARNARGSVRESADADEHAFRRGRLYASIGIGASVELARISLALSPRYTSIGAVRSHDMESQS
jgi:hypothetical protein